MKIVVRGPERHLPTSVPYRSEVIYAFDAEMEVPDDAVDKEALRLKLGTALVDAERAGARVFDLDVVRRLQAADLDAQEAHLRKQFDMPEPDPTRPVGSASAVTVKRLRALSAELFDATGKGIDAIPSTETDAVAAVANAEKSLAAVKAGAQAAATATPAPSGALAPSGHTNPNYPQGNALAARLRVCSDPRHGKEPLPIETRVWDFSVDRFGKPLCRAHQPGGRA